MTKHEAIQLLRNRGLISEMVNPGGRELRFSDGTTLQLADQDEEEDHQRIIAFCNHHPHKRYRLNTLLLV